MEDSPPPGLCWTPGPHIFPPHPDPLPSGEGSILDAEEGKPSKDAVFLGGQAGFLLHEPQAWSQPQARGPESIFLELSH